MPLPQRSEFVPLTIDEVEVRAANGQTVLSVARGAGIYIPYLCAQPDLPPECGVISRKAVYRGEEEISGEGGGEFLGCGLCLVEIQGEAELQRACAVRVQRGMRVHTDTPGLREIRRENLTKLLRDHPHECLICPHREGCSLTYCSFDLPAWRRCCPKFGHCELRRLADYVGIRKDVPRARLDPLPLVEKEPLFLLNYNLCINCLRCVRMCHDVQEVGALGFTVRDGQRVVGTIAPTLKASGCRFCGACAEACPAGVFTEKEPNARRKKPAVSPPVFPPEKLLKLEAENVAAVPEVEGVYSLLDRRKRTIYIGGTRNLRRELDEQRRENATARFFTFELDVLYTQREAELLQRFVQREGRLPEQNSELDDLL